MTSPCYLLQQKIPKNAAKVFLKAGCIVPQNIIESLISKKQLTFELDYDKTNIKHLIDYQPNTLNLPLFSQKFKDIIDQNLKGLENIDWVKAYIYENRFYQKYYVLRFNTLFDVLDLDKTKYFSSTNIIGKPVFDNLKIEPLAIFTVPATYNNWKITTEIYVNEAIKNAIQNLHLSGIEFQILNSSI